MVKAPVVYMQGSFGTIVVSFGVVHAPLGMDRCMHRGRRRGKGPQAIKTVLQPLLAQRSWVFHFLGVNYWTLNFYLRAKLECRVALDLVALGWFQVPRGGCDRYSGRFDINSTLVCLAAVSFDMFSTLF